MITGAMVYFFRDDESAQGGLIRGASDAVFTRSIFEVLWRGIMWPDSRSALARASVRLNGFQQPYRLFEQLFAGVERFCTVSSLQRPHL